MKTEISRVISFVLLPLVVGLFVYVYLKQGNLFLSSLNPSCHYYSCPGFVKNNLADGLWLFAFLNMLQIIWKQESSQKLTWVVTVTILSILTEFLQKYHLLKGVFDVLDILTYIIAFASSLIISTIIFKKTSL